MTKAEAAALKALGDNRADFMKRWFAIAISVGFATAVSSMPWLRDGIILDPNLPIDWGQVKQCARLAAAVVATILSWDGYFQSISNKPLTDGSRFSIDVFLVFLYLFLLLTSKFDYFWLWVHAAAFVIYCWWDFLSIRKHRRAYVTDKAPDDFNPTVSQVYLGSFKDDELIYRGPAITLLWPIYFWAIPLTYHFLLGAADRERPETTFVYAILVIVGLFTYRYDKKTRLSLGKRLRLIGMSVVGILSADFVLWLVG